MDGAFTSNPVTSTVSHIYSNNLNLRGVDMQSVHEFVPYINSQIAFYKKSVAYKPPHVQSIYQSNIDNLEGLLRAISECNTNQSDTHPHDQTHSSIDDAVFKFSTDIAKQDLSQLPPELLENLGISESSKSEMLIINLINKATDKQMSLQVLMVAIYKESGEITDKTQLNNKLIRMIRKGQLYSVAKGVYSTENIELLSGILPLDDDENDV